MKIFFFVQALFKINVGKAPTILGSCFRVNDSNYYITANHCLDRLESKDLAVSNIFRNNDLLCSSIHRHDKADIAIIKVEGQIPKEYGNFNIVEADHFVGTTIHCFGMMEEGEHIKGDSPMRVIGGIIQRDFIHKNGPYESWCFEFSSPIPKGMSGGPAFLARNEKIVVGVAIGTIKQEVVISGFEEYQNGNLKQKERISEIIRYGVILRLNPIKKWIYEIIS
jgi:hypothetical protein